MRENLFRAKRVNNGGWHYEVVPTDEISKTEPFCYSMPLTKYYIERCEMEVVDNPELLQEVHK